MDIFYLYFGVSLLLWIILRTYYRKHHGKTKPWISCLVETFVEPLYLLKIGPWSGSTDVKSCLQEAIKLTGLSDFGPTPEDFIKKYELVQNTTFKKIKLIPSPFGFYLLKRILTKRFETRLRFFDYMKKHPVINKIKMKSPLFIIGFPRTGTTFLHEILGLSEQLKMHYTWEQMEPIPLTDSELRSDLEKDRKFRYNKNKPDFDLQVNFIGSVIQSIHRIGYDEPEECTTPCALELPWSISELPSNVYAADELFPLGASKAFHYYKQYLQMLTFQSDERYNAQNDFTWMLKCPFHLPYLHELHESFPDSTVVWTHRNPVECIASACSLYEALLQAAFEGYSIDRSLLGKHVMNYTVLSLRKAEETFKKLGNKFKVIHIRYADNVKDSKNICKRIFENAGIEYSQNYEQKLDNYLKESNEKRKKLKKSNKSDVVHDYKLEDYGLTKELVSQVFHDYINKYNL
eukprot:gene6845-9372_t